jgi:hypothetical protein
MGRAPLHKAWDGVFQHFPERLTNDVHGYIATADCNEMGERKRLYFGGRWWDVAVADCLERSRTPQPDWLVDVDSRIWYAAGAPMRPVLAVVCDEVGADEP